MFCTSDQEGKPGGNYGLQCRVQVWSGRLQSRVSTPWRQGPTSSRASLCQALLDPPSCRKSDTCRSSPRSGRPKAANSPPRPPLSSPRFRSPRPRPQKARPTPTRPSSGATQTCSPSAISTSCGTSRRSVRRRYPRTRPSPEVSSPNPGSWSRWSGAEDRLPRPHPGTRGGSPRCISEIT